MKKKVITLIALFVLINLGQGCWKEYYQIVDIDFNAAKIRENNKDKQQISYSCTSTIKDKLVFIVSYKTEYLYGYIPNFGNVCYAFSSLHVNDNALIQETFSLTFDKPFTYHGNVISQSTNIFGIESIKREIDEYENYTTFCNSGADIVFDFSDSFFKNAVFDSTEYIATFSCKTTDDKFFSRDITITFE